VASAAQAAVRAWPGVMGRQALERQPSVVRIIALRTATGLWHLRRQRFTG